MSKKRDFSKKALVQTDWIVSLGIFLTYLVWFFIAMRPILSGSSVNALPTDEIKENFMVNASWTVNQTPIFIKSNKTITHLPIAISFPFKGNEKNYGINNRYWTIHDNKLFFLATFPAKKQDVYLIHSTQNYTKPTIANLIQAEETFTDTGDLEVFYDNALIDYVMYKQSMKVKSFNILKDSTPFIPEKAIFTNDNILAIYRMESHVLNHTSYVFNDNNRILNYFSGDGMDIRLEITLDKYKNYFVNPALESTINYNSSSCEKIETDYINVYDSDRGLTFLFSDDVHIEICHNNKLDLIIDFELDNTFNYNMIFHEDGSDTRSLKTEYAAEYGVTNTLNGISEYNLFNIRNTTYAAAKAEWSRSNEFNITIFNASNNMLFDIGTQPRQYSDVQSRIYPLWILDKYGNQSRAVLNILIWK